MILKTIFYKFSSDIDENFINKFIQSMCNSSLEVKKLDEFLLYKYNSYIILTDMFEVYEISLEYKVPCIIFLTQTNRNYSFPECKYAITSLEDLEESYFAKVFDRYYGIPWTILETKRCILREQTVEDVKDLYKIYQNKEIIRYTEDLFEKEEDEIEYTKQYIKNVYEFYGFGVWVVLDKETGELIGRAGLSYRDEFETPELGYVIDINWQQKGIATEVCEAILNYAKEDLGFHTIRVLTYSENLASVKLCHKLQCKYDKIYDIGGQNMEQYLWTDENSIG